MQISKCEERFRFQTGNDLRQIMRAGFRKTYKGFSSGLFFYDLISTAWKFKKKNSEWICVLYHNYLMNDGITDAELHRNKSWWGMKNNVLFVTKGGRKCFWGTSSICKGEEMPEWCHHPLNNGFSETICHIKNGWTKTGKD